MDIYQLAGKAKALLLKSLAACCAFAQLRLGILTPVPSSLLISKLQLSLLFGGKQKKFQFGLFQTVQHNLIIFLQASQSRGFFYLSVSRSRKRLC